MMTNSITKVGPPFGAPRGPPFLLHPHQRRRKCLLGAPPLEEHAETEEID